MLGQCQVEVGLGQALVWAVPLWVLPPLETPASLCPSLPCAFLPHL